MSEQHLDTNDLITVTRVNADGVGTPTAVSLAELTYQSTKDTGWADYSAS
jgi:hypothetical protein